MPIKLSRFHLAQMETIGEFLFNPRNINTVSRELQTTCHASSGGVTINVSASNSPFLFLSKRLFFEGNRLPAKKSAGNTSCQILSMIGFSASGLGTPFFPPGMLRTKTFLDILAETLH
jgi:hypothetical protein